MSELLRVTADDTRIVADLEGRPVTVPLRVFNLSTIVDGYRIDAPTPPHWLRVDPADVRLLPGTDEVVTVPFTVSDSAQVPAHDVTVRLRIRSIANPDVARSVHVEVSVPAVDADVALALEPEMLRGERAETRLTAHNRVGNVPVRLALRGSDPEGVVRFAFNPRVFDLGPGESAHAQVLVSAPRPHDSSTLRRELTVTAADGQREFTASGTLLQQPPPERRPLPLKPLLRVLLTVLGSVMLALGALLPWTASPVVRSGLDWNYLAVCEALNATCQGVRDDLVLPLFLLSAGIPVLVLALLALLGLLGTGGMTRFAGIVAVLYILAFAGVLMIAGTGAALTAGVAMVAAGGIVAAIGGLLARP